MTMLVRPPEIEISLSEALATNRCMSGIKSPHDRLRNYNGLLNRRYTLVRLLREIIVALRDLA
jgi:hypothetical protein